MQRKQWIVGAVGAALLLGGLSWWLWRRGPGAKIRGEIVCSTNPYTGIVRKDDYVVLSLGTLDHQWSEPTWAQVRAVRGQEIDVQLVGEVAEGNTAKPLATDRHGFSIGDRITLAKSCIFDRFRPGQSWRVICGPTLFLSGYQPISPDQASLLGVGDRAQILIRNVDGEDVLTWIDIDDVSAGTQAIRGQVGGQSSINHGPQPGDVVEFLRDCVVSAEFSG